jgi:hypothetical protein
MKINKQIKSVAFAIAALAGTSANAGIISEWTVGVDAAFLPGSVVSTSGSNPVVMSNSNRTLRWGTSQGSGQSGLDINNSPVSTVVNTGVGVTLPPVANVSLTHTNNPIQGASLDKVTLSVSLTLTPLTPSLGSLAPQTLNFLIDFLETPNSANPCANGGSNGSGVNEEGCGDIFVIGSDSLNYSFFADSDGAGGDDPQEYFISFVEMTSGLNSLPTAACLSATGSSAPCLGFVTPEKDTTTFGFGALITTERVVIDPDPDPNDVPAPGVLALMGLALASMGAVRRRRKV